MSLNNIENSCYHVHSDKCLNQYKMNIFCKETQAQLELHPHLQNTTLLPENLCKTTPEPNLPLITPDLWLRDCHSPPPSLSERSPPSPPLQRTHHHSPLLGRSGTTTALPPQLRVPNKMFDRQNRKRKRTNTANDDAPQSLVYSRFPSQGPVYCTPPRCKSPTSTQSQMASDDNTSTNDLPRLPPPPLYPLNTPPQSLLPPPMILVPYPIMLPIPIPIPIPIPLPFLQKECDNTSKEKKNEKQSQ